MLIGIVFMPCDSLAAKSKETKRGWQNKAVEEIFKIPLGTEQAVSFRLDYNSFAVETSSCLLVFDYCNDRPARQYEYKGKRLHRSLLTGVINPDELKDETVVFFFSHDHPSENFLKLLGYRDKIKEARYLITEEAYSKYEDRIEELKRQEEEDPPEHDNKVIDAVKIIKPSKIYTIERLVIRPMSQRYFLDITGKELYPGVEFLIETPNGLAIYHSGSLLCHRCSDVKAVDNFQPQTRESSLKIKEQKVIPKDAGKLVFQDGKLVTIDGRKVDKIKKTISDKRLALAIYTNPLEPKGVVHTWSTYVPEYAIATLSPSDFYVSDYHTDKIRKQKELLRFMERDVLITELGAYANADELLLQHNCQQVNKYYMELEGNSQVVSDIAISGQNWCLNSLREEKSSGKPHLYSLCRKVRLDEELRLRGECELFDGKAPSPVYFGGYSEPEGTVLFTVFSDKIFVEEQ
ncbi:hypothetical protein ACFL2J_04825 [Candidatus Omnitrophota bacterium]